MRTGVYIADCEKHDLFSALDPDALAAMAPVWKEDVIRFSPWVKEDIDGFRFWRGEGYQGQSTVFITGRCTSTMDVARELITSRLMEPWDSVIGVEQSAGRGRKKREWISPPGNLHGTWYWPPIGNTDSSTPGWINLASLLAGAVIASGLDKIGIPVRIKWPNDLIVNDRKLCGILVENRGGHLIAGIGINLVSAPHDRQLRDDFVIPATCLDAVKKGGTPLALWTRLMESGRKRIEDITASLSPVEFVKLFENRMAWIGRRVLIREGSETPYPAIIVGLADDGGLKIRRNGQIDIIYTGNIIPFDSSDFRDNESTKSNS